MHTRYTLTLDIQETISFAQHPGGSDCGCPQYGCFLKRNVLRLDLKVSCLIIIIVVVVVAIVTVITTTTTIIIIIPVT